MNNTYKEVKEHTILSIYGKEIKEEDYPNYNFIDFRPPKYGENYINIYGYDVTPYNGSSTMAPRIITGKKKRKRYIFEEDNKGNYSSIGISVCKDVCFYSSTELILPRNYKKFTVREEEF